MLNMEYLLFFVINVLLFLIQPTNSISVVNLSKYYEDSVNELVSKHLNGTKFCGSILLPTEKSLKTSLEATLFNVKRDGVLDEKSHVDLCCRSLYKCDVFKHTELNYTNEWYIRHCECAHSFRMCLMDLNTPLSKELAYIHSLNATKCYAKNHPIIKCIKYQEYSEIKSEIIRFVHSSKREQFLKRCLKYEFAEDQPRKRQTFDIPFNDSLATSTFPVHAYDEIEKNMDSLGEMRTYSTKSDLQEILSKINDNIILGCEAFVPLLKDLNNNTMSTILSVSTYNKHSLRTLFGILTKFVDVVCKNKKLLKDKSTAPCETNSHKYTFIGGTVQHNYFN